eukprot:GHVS01064416.1.p1 GENE.GHVS01064416.1~~GHVS01064416.1.p1  ORF type:complete len:441 (-),score=53.48 GHVS01064416.1:256-1578(-)
MKALLVGSLVALVILMTVPGEAAPKRMKSYFSQGGSHHGTIAGYASNKVRGEPQYTCPEGYNQEGKECSKIITSSPVDVCLDGDLTDEGCRMVKPAVKSCPPEFTKKCAHHWGHSCSCVKVSIESKVRGDCPEGTADSPDFESCVKDIPAPIMEKCPAGFMKEVSSSRETHCYSEEFMDPECKCNKEDASLEDGKCVFEEIVDCTGGGGDKGAAIGHGHIRYLAPKKFKSFSHFGSHSVPVPMGHNNSTKGGVVTSTVVSQTCRRRKVASPVCTCPPESIVIRSGGHFQKSSRPIKCKIQEFVEAEKICSITDLPIKDHSECRTTAEVAPPFICPANFTESCSHHHFHGSPSCKCVLFERAELEAMCLSEDYELTDGVCVKLEESITSCPAPSVEVGDLCESVKTVPPLVTYTSTFTCTGKGCDGSVDHLKKKKHLEHLQ